MQPAAGGATTFPGPFCAQAEIAAGQGEDDGSISGTLWQLLLIIIVPVVAIVGCAGCIAYHLSKETTFYASARLMMVAVGLKRKAPPSPPPPQQQALDELPPEDEVLCEMMDMALCRDAHKDSPSESKFGLVLAEQDVQQLWPNETGRKQKMQLQHRRDMLHHDRMPEKKHVKYLELGPRAPTDHNSADWEEEVAV